MNIVLVGPHGAGKTTLGTLLADRLGWPFHDEVGRRLAEAVRPGDVTAESAQESFDERVFAEEIARDLDHRGPRIIETWHPGNLAYAEARSPAVADRWVARLPTLSGLVIPLRASLRALKSRQSESGDPAFFHRVGLSARRWAHRLGLEITEPVCTDRLPPDVLARELTNLILTHRRLA